MTLIRKPVFCLALILLLASLACTLPANQATSTAFPPTHLPDDQAEPGPADTPTSAPSPEPPSEAPQATAAPFTFAAAWIDPAGNLWTWQDSTRTPIQVSSEGDIQDVVLSPDGRLAAFVRSADYLHHSLWLLTVGETEATELVTQDQFTEMRVNVDAVSAGPDNLTWVPGATQPSLAFTSRPTFEGPGRILNNDLWVLNTQTRALTRLLSPGDGGEFSYSPDGRYLAISTPENISLMNADGSERRDRVLTFLPVSTYSEYQYYPAPQWAPDSSGIRVAIPPADPLNDSTAQPTLIYQIASSGGAAISLGSLSVSFLNPVLFSPDFSRLVYLSEGEASGDGILDLHLASSDLSGDSVYQSGEILSALWSGDSARFVFFSNPDNRPQTGAVDGSAPAPLTDSASVIDPQWLDADTFWFLSKTESGWELRQSDVGGASSLITTITASGERTPHFTLSQ